MERPKDPLEENVILTGAFVSLIVHSYEIHVAYCIIFRAGLRRFSARQASKVVNVPCSMLFLLQLVRKP